MLSSQDEELDLQSEQRLQQREVAEGMKRMKEDMARREEEQARQQQEFEDKLRTKRLEIQGQERQMQTQQPRKRNGVVQYVPLLGKSIYTCETILVESAFLSFCNSVREYPGHVIVRCVAQT